VYVDLSEILFHIVFYSENTIGKYMFELLLLDKVMTEQHRCLTEAIYHEARGESYSGQLMVGFVIENRVMSDQFPNDFCQVIEQPWQFSFTHELPTRTMHEEDAAQFAAAVAEIIMTTPNPLPETVYYYHTHQVNPPWNYDLLDVYAVVGNHKFYEELY